MTADEAGLGHERILRIAVEVELVHLYCNSSTGGNYVGVKR